MVNRLNISYVTNRIETQVIQPFLYPTRMRNKKKKNKSFLNNSFINFNEKSFLKNKKNNLFLFLLRNQTYTLGCVTCVWIIGGFP